MATQSARIGWRPYLNLTSVQATANLLDSYSGSAAAYSLRKLKSSYTGSAIRVRRSSDNTEQNIGFDSNGNLDTYALSAFVGTGNGFASVWYDQSGNSNNLIQTTAANQPSIILSGIINTQNGKPILITDYNSYMINNSVSINGTTNSIFATIKMVTTRGNIAIMSGYGNDNQHFVSRNINGNGRYYDSGGQEITAAVLPNGLNLIGIHENSSGITVYENGANLVTNFAHSVNNTTGIVIFRRDVQDGNYMQSGSGFAELIVYGNSSKLIDNSGISNNINTYYSVYPNPTSVWNLLNAAYNADTTASSSLKTSLFAAYNGESNTNDSFGSNNGTAQGGLTYGTGKIGNSFQFNGSNSYVGLPNNSMNLTGDFTIAFWLYHTASGAQTLISNLYYQSTPTNIYKGWGLYIDNLSSSTNKLGFIIPRQTTDYVGFEFNTSLTLNAWNHVVITRVSGVDTYAWINNTLSTTTYTGPINSGNKIIDPSYYTTQRVSIGAQNGSGTPATFMSVNSKIDGLTIWNKQLTASERTELYNSGNGAQYIGDNFYKPTTNDALLVKNGTPQGGLTYGVGKVGTAFQFNGTTAYVSLPDNSLNLTGDFSISFWYYHTATGAQRILYNVATQTTPTNIGKGWQVNMGTIGASNTINFGILKGTTSTYTVWEFTTTTMTLNTWHHVVINRQASTNTFCWINGVAQAYTLRGSGIDITYDPTYHTTQPISIGCYRFLNGTTGEFMKSGSKLDGLNLWNRQLTSTEIAELYNSGNGKQYPN